MNFHLHRTTRVLLTRLSLAGSLALTLAGCATLGQIGALQNVDFALQGVSNVRLAGIDLNRVRSFSDLGFGDGARLVAAVANRDLPLELDVLVQADNPAENYADARLVRMDWTFLIEDTETVSGTLAEEFLLRRGEPTIVPIEVGMNLVDFYEGSAQDLFELAQSLAGVGGSPKELTVEALPTVETALGPIRYPSPLRLSTTVGGSTRE